MVVAVMTYLEMGLEKRKMRIIYTFSESDEHLKTCSIVVKGISQIK
jgi:hypothetical protein